MRILIAMTTGRHTFKNTLDMIVSNLIKHNHFENHDISLMINFDPNYRNIPLEYFNYENDMNYFSEIIRTGPDDLKYYHDLLMGYRIDSNTATLLLQGSGYGQKKNIIFIETLRREYDLVIFWDDDEYPVACCKGVDEQDFTWIETDILEAHISSGHPEIDVAFGFSSGYDSPLVPGIETILSSVTARVLGEALSIGTEFITVDFFERPEQTFLMPPIVPEVSEILPVRGGKWVTGGNLSVRSKSLRNGRIPPYYTPRDSRGDDTILSMQLDQARVFRIPSGVFHDCFLKHPSITGGIYPSSFEETSVSGEQYLQRFAAALCGWLAYSPLMVLLRDGSSSEASLQEMLSLLQFADTRLGREYPMLVDLIPGKSLSDLLLLYKYRAQQQYSELQLVTEIWSSLCSRI